MKKSLLCLVLIVLVSSIAGCDSTSSAQNGGSGVAYLASCEAFEENKALSDEVRMFMDQGLTVHLCSNASTGYSWSDADIADTAIIRQVDKEYQPKAGEGGQPVVGEPGQEVFGFEVLQPGTTTIKFSYGQPWEGGEQGVWTLVLTVTVE